MVDGEIERQPRVFVSAVRTLRDLLKEIPVLALDGTGSIDLNRRIFGEHMTGERFAVPRNAEVWQVTSKTFSRQSITGTDRRGNPISPKKTHEAARLRRQVLDLLKMLPGKVLLVTYKQAEEILRPDLPPHVQTAHFGALRGLNAYEHCETAVVMGREQPSRTGDRGAHPPFLRNRRRAVHPDRGVRPPVPRPAHAQRRSERRRSPGASRHPMPGHARAGA